MIRATYIPATDETAALTEEATRLACVVQAATARLDAINAKIKAQGKEVVILDVDESVIDGTNSGAAARVAFGKKHFYANQNELHNIKNVFQEKKAKSFLEVEAERKRLMQEKENDIKQRRLEYTNNARSGRVVVVVEGRKPQ